MIITLYSFALLQPIAWKRELRMAITSFFFHPSDRRLSGYRVFGARFRSRGRRRGKRAPSKFRVFRRFRSEYGKESGGKAGQTRELTHRDCNAAKCVAMLLEFLFELQNWDKLATIPLRGF